jgi:dGTPase
VNEDLVEAICLAHDLGHPPFGHAGEAALDEMMRDAGGFNHNFQSYRVVTELEERYSRWAGLNLTRETLWGLAKHETSFDLSAAAGIDPALRGSLEAQIADLTDELAYTAHDLDDGLQAKLINPEELETLEIWQLISTGLDARWRGDEVMRHRLIRELVGLLVGDVLTTTEENLRRCQPKSSMDVQKHSENLVGYSATIDRMRLELRNLLHELMYHHYRVVRMQRRAQRFIHEMFEELMRDPRQLPDEWQRCVPQRGLARAVADYIGSMTDRSALQEYRRLFDPSVRP